MRNYPTIHVNTTSDSIVIMEDGEHVAEYHSTNPRNDARKMRGAIRDHLDAGGTMCNYQW